MTIDLEKVYDGHIIRVNRDDNRAVYVKSVYRGKVDYVTDYTHARHYKHRESAENVISQYIEPQEG